VHHGPGRRGCRPRPLGDARSPREKESGTLLPKTFAATSPLSNNGCARQRLRSLNVSTKAVAAAAQANVRSRAPRRRQGNGLRRRLPGSATLQHNLRTCRARSRSARGRAEHAALSRWTFRQQSDASRKSSRLVHFDPHMEFTDAGTACCIAAPEEHVRMLFSAKTGLVLRPVPSLKQFSECFPEVLD
jgi:hypothetical protein